MLLEGPHRAGKDEIREDMQPIFDLFDTSKTINPIDEVRVLGDQAYSHRTNTFDETPKEGGETVSLSERILVILEKQVDGSRKIAIDCHNYNGPSI